MMENGSEMISEELIDKVLAGEGSEEDARNVSSWLATDEGQLFLASHMDRMLRSDPPDPIRDEDRVPTYDMYEDIQKKIRKRGRVMAGINIAAAAACFLFLAVFVGERFFGFTPRSSSMDYAFIPRGSQMTFVLNDGSQAVVNADTRFGYPRRFGIGRREVALEGEAYFDISRNPLRPFVIKMGESEVIVHGTKFNVKAYPEEERITVGLESGKVSFCSGDGINVALVPGEKLSFDKKTRSYSVERMEDVSTLSAWKSDQVCFDDASLEEMVSVLSRLFDVGFQIQDESLLRYSCTLTSSSKDLMRILNEIALITPIRFERQGEMILILPD